MSHNTSYCLIEVVNKAGLNVLFVFIKGCSNLIKIRSPLLLPHGDYKTANSK